MASSCDAIHPSRSHCLFRHIVRKVLMFVAVGMTAACRGSPTASDAVLTKPASPAASVPGPARPVVVAGESQACVLRPGGAVSCWGQGYGAGASTANEIVAPHVLASPPFVGVASGARHVCALAGDGSAYCWGSNASGQLGASSTVARTIPTRIRGVHPVAPRVASGLEQDCAVDASGTAYWWGENLEGAAGGTAQSYRVPNAVIRQPEPWRTIVAGAAFTCALSDAGRAWCWGNNFLGYLGTGFQGPATPVPQEVTGGHQFRQLIASPSNACGIDVADDLWCWGSNNRGILALPARQEFSATPVLVSAP